MLNPDLYAGTVALDPTAIHGDAKSVFHDANTCGPFSMSIHSASKQRNKEKG
jgi:hypothetical protein